MFMPIARAQRLCFKAIPYVNTAYDLLTNDFKWRTAIWTHSFWKPRCGDARASEPIEPLQSSWDPFGFWYLSTINVRPFFYANDAIFLHTFVAKAKLIETKSE